MRHTPLYANHVARGAKVVDFSGWALPVQFAGIVQEHLHTRAAVSLFDCGHMGEFVVRGRAAISAFDRLVCGAFATLPVGRCRYGAILNESGGVIDDTIGIRLAEDELYVVTNAGPFERVSELFSAEVPGIENVSDATAKIDVQGPQSRDLLERFGLKAAAELRFYHAARVQWRGRDVILSRTGYTGELGYEIFMLNELAVPLWDALLEEESVWPAGLGARDTLRTEMGYPLSGQDFDESRTPIEAGLDRFIAWDKPFVGREALLRQRERTDLLRMHGIRTPDRRAPRHGFEVTRNGRAVGTVTSGTFGPSVGCGIGLAYLAPEIGQTGPGLTAGPRQLPVSPADLPFYTSGTCRD